MKNKPLIILIHGYTGNKDFAPNPTIRPAYFEKDDYNIISIDYGAIAPSPCYLQACYNSQTVANCTAQLLDYLISSSIVSLPSIHVVGFSLGGHVAGFIANYLKSGKLKRITSLDPAQPFFLGNPPFWTIDPSDADFVLVLHTAIIDRSLFTPVGHADFYANKGFEQPGCEDEDNIINSCSHYRAPLYFAESINSAVEFYGKSLNCPLIDLFGICKYAIFGEYTPST